MLLRFGQLRSNWPEVGNAAEGPGGRLVDVAVNVVVRLGLVLDSVAVVVAIVAVSSDVAEDLGALDEVDTVNMLRSARAVVLGFRTPLVIELR